MVKYDDKTIDEIRYFRLTLFVGIRYFKMFFRAFPDDVKQIAALIALEVEELDEATAKRQIQKSFCYYLRSYGFAQNAFSEWYVPEMSIDWPSFGYSILKVHSLDRQDCSIPGCLDQPIRYFPRYGRVCQQHSEIIQRRRKRPEQALGIGTKTYICSSCEKKYCRFQSLQHYDHSFCSRKCYEDHQREVRKRNIPTHIVREIKKRLKAGKGQRTVAREFNLPRSTVVNIDKGRWYAEVLV